MARKRIWTEEEQSNIIEDYTKNNLTLKQITTKNKTNTRTIYQILDSNNIPRRGSYSKVNHDLKDNFFENIDNEEKAYYLGILLTDGSVAKGHNRKDSLSLTSADRDLIEDFKIQINAGSKIRKDERVRNNKVYTTYEIKVRSNKLVNDLQEYGMVPNKTKHMIKFYDRISTKLIHHYVRGLLDGDGSTYISNKALHVSFTGANRSLVESFRDIVDRLIDKDNPLKVTEYKNVYKVTYNGKFAEDLCEVIYNNATVFLKRKKIIYLSKVEDIV